MIKKIITFLDEVQKKRPALVTGQVLGYYRIIPFTSSRSTGELNIKLNHQEWGVFYNKRLNIAKAMWVKKDEVGTHIESDLFLKNEKIYSVSFKKEKKYIVEPKLRKVPQRGNIFTVLNYIDRYSAEYVIKKKGAGVERASGLKFQYQLVSHINNYEHRQLNKFLWTIKNKKDFSSLKEKFSLELEKFSETNQKHYTEELEKLGTYIFEPYKPHLIEGVNRPSRSFISIDYLIRAQSLLNKLILEQPDIDQNTQKMKM